MSGTIQANDRTIKVLQELRYRGFGVSINCGDHAQSDSPWSVSVSGTGLPDVRVEDPDLVVAISRVFSAVSATDE